jgi:membrane-associated phospholipid phosphatase
MAEIARSGSPDVVEIPLGPGRARRERRRRRPSGAPPPLPHKLGGTEAVWISLLVLVVLACALLRLSPSALTVIDRADTQLLTALAKLRTSWLTTAMRGIMAAGSGWSLTILGLTTIVALLALRRLRHLLVFLVSAFLLGQLASAIYIVLTRPRPYGVRILGGWSGFSMPSPTVAVLAYILVGIIYTLVVPGRPRDVAKWAALMVVSVVVLARLYLAVDHPSDVVFAAVLGVAIPVAMFRWFTPNEAFPISYKRGGKTAHLDVSGARGDAIRAGLRDQLGLVCVDIEPFGQESSGGSTPLRLRIAGDPDTYLFAKLYAKSHVRADRWYKIMRTILYGRLEDEASFHSVRRFVEYEDYALRLLFMSGIRVPTPYGIVEITPEREYLIVMEMFEGAVEMGKADVDEGTIDDALALVRRLWDIGVAHRDIKPGNLLARDNDVLLVDASFVEVRPSPWRQAVDLANMMLVLALRSDPDVVYRRAVHVFTPDELAEAFSATRGIASPTQLRVALKNDGRQLLTRFRSLAPPRPPIAIQRWSVARVALAGALASATAIAGFGTIIAFLPSGNGSDMEVTKPPDCGTGTAMILMAQAVESATLLPCIETVPNGWDFGGADLEDGQAWFWLNAEDAGERAVTVTLTHGCPIDGEEVRVDGDGSQRLDVDLTEQPLRQSRSYVFDGGCATYAFSFPAGALSFVNDADEALAFTPREAIVQSVVRDEDLMVCGAGAPCPG